MIIELYKAGMEDWRTKMFDKSWLVKQQYRTTTYTCKCQKHTLGLRIVETGKALAHQLTRKPKAVKSGYHIIVRICLAFVYLEPKH